MDRKNRLRISPETVFLISKTSRFSASASGQKEVDSRLRLLAVSSYIHRNPIQTKQPMVERLELYPYSLFPLFWNDLLPAPAFLDQELLPEPFEKNNTAYCMYCLTYMQNAEEEEHVEDMEPPVM